MGIKDYLRIVRTRINYTLNYISNKARKNSVSFGSIIAKGVILNNCKIAKYSYIGQYSILNSVWIGRYSSIAPYVMIGGAEHSHYWLAMTHFLSKENTVGNLTRIGNDVWIGDAQL